MAIQCPSCSNESTAEFEWADNSDIQGRICLSCFQVFDLEDHGADAERGKGKKIGHKKNKYKTLGKQIQTWHIRKKDIKEPKKEPKKVRGG
jgi:hypothetical protein